MPQFAGTEMTSTTVADRKNIAMLLEERRSDGVFRVHPRALTDPDIFELEMSKVFETTWVFIALESEIENVHDYVTRQIGQRSVVLMRDGTGSPRGFVNNCSHRGTLLRPLASGSIKLHVCRSDQILPVWQ
jgi:hypothetical protein